LPLGNGASMWRVSQTTMPARIVTSTDDACSGVVGHPGKDAARASHRMGEHEEEIGLGHAERGGQFGKPAARATARGRAHTTQRLH
jgi:hypothetical protein